MQSAGRKVSTAPCKQLPGCSQAVDDVCDVGPGHVSTPSVLSTHHTACVSQGNHVTCHTFVIELNSRKGCISPPAIPRPVLTWRRRFVRQQAAPTG